MQRRRDAETQEDKKAEWQAGRQAGRNSGLVRRVECPPAHLAERVVRVHVLVPRREGASLRSRGHGHRHGDGRPGGTGCGGVGGKGRGTG